MARRPRSSVSRPLIGVTGRRWPAARLAEYLPSALLDAEFDLHFTEYPAAIARAGGIPVELARDAPVAELLERLDGVVISGGADVDPSFYGASPEPGLMHPEPDRDAWELAVIAEALRIDLPLLGICRGAQLINVHLGGTLVQHVELAEGDGHPRFDEERNVACHVVRFSRGTLAHDLYGPELGVNSLHHQTVSRVGNELVVSGRASDGVVEALELPGRNVFAVQWHPEMFTSTVDPSFTWLVDRASRYRLEVS
jgi:putative glutamine amidotransferase